MTWTINNRRGCFIWTTRAARIVARVCQRTLRNGKVGGLQCISKNGSTSKQVDVHIHNGELEIARRRTGDRLCCLNSARFLRHVGARQHAFYSTPSLLRFSVSSTAMCEGPRPPMGNIDFIFNGFARVVALRADAVASVTHTHTQHNIASRRPTMTKTLENLVGL